MHCYQTGTIRNNKGSSLGSREMTLDGNMDIQKETRNTGKDT